MHYHAMLRLSRADIALVETPPARRPTSTNGEPLRQFRVPLGEQPFDALFKTEFSVCGLRHFAYFVRRDQNTALHQREVQNIRAIHRFYHGDHSYDVRLLAMWD